MYSFSLSHWIRISSLSNDYVKAISPSLFSRSIISDSRDPMDHSLPGSSVHGILQARILEWFPIFLLHESHDVSLKKQSWIQVELSQKRESRQPSHKIRIGILPHIQNIK